MQANGTSRLGFSTADEFCTADSMPRNAQSVSEMLEPMPSTRRSPFGFHAAAKVAPRLDHEPRPEDDPYSVLQRITEMLKAGHRDRPVRKPLGVVFTKLDALWHKFPEGSALKRPEPGGAGCDEQDSLDVHHHVQALLHDWDGPQIDQYLKHNYRCFRYFGVSALGAIPTPDKRVSTVISPYRVGDPILWLLSKAHMVPVIRGR